MADASHFELVALAKAVSRLLGWFYFLCWSVSFYAQPILNLQRRSTQGLAIDFPVCNILGFAAYTASTAAFLFSSTIRSQYAFRHPVSPEPTVRFNDFAFAAHALLLCMITYSQFFPRLWGFKVGARQRSSRVVLGVFWGSIVAVLTVIAIVRTQSHDGGYDPESWAWIDVIYSFGYIKLIVTVIKYVPQAYTNYKRKSTVGWSIVQILLDFAGGITSILQLVIDASLQADWSGITGNPVKFGLGNISIMFDVIFMTQHFVLYRDKGKMPADTGGSDEESLLAQAVE